MGAQNSLKPTYGNTLEADLKGVANKKLKGESTGDKGTQ